MTVTGNRKSTGPKQAMYWMILVLAASQSGCAGNPEASRTQHAHTANTVSRLDVSSGYGRGPTGWSESDEVNGATTGTIKLPTVNLGPETIVRTLAGAASGAAMHSVMTSAAPGCAFQVHCLPATIAALSLASLAPAHAAVIGAGFGFLGSAVESRPVSKLNPHGAHLAQFLPTASDVTGQLIQETAQLVDKFSRDSSPSKEGSQHVPLKLAVGIVRVDHDGVPNTTYPVRLRVDAVVQLGASAVRTRVRYLSASRVGATDEASAAHVQALVSKAIEKLSRDVVHHALAQQSSMWASAPVIENKTARQVKSDAMVEPASKGASITRFPVTQTLKPVLSWRPPALPKAVTASDRNRDLLYDFELYASATTDEIVTPVRLARYRDGLATNEYQIDEPLEPCVRYFWSVRARWYAGMTANVSAWAVTGTKLPTADAARPTTITPTLRYARFQTPCDTRRKGSSRKGEFTSISKPLAQIAWARP